MKKINLLLMLLPFLAVMSCAPETKEEQSDNMENTTEFDEEALLEKEERESEMREEQRQDGQMQMAMADIEPKSNSKMTGKATFTMESEGTVRLKLSIENATPGTHAVHLHEKGDCSAKDASSAGGHWNPTNMPHGKRGEGKFHKGDVDNMKVGQDGRGTLEMTVNGWTIGGPDSTNILEKAILIHADPDDFKSQPAGNAGARVGCGIIKSSR